MEILFVDDISKQQTKKQIKEQEKALKKLWRLYKKRKRPDYSLTNFIILTDTITQLELKKGEKYSQYLLNKLNRGEK